MWFDRTFIAAAGCIVLILAFGRCSPMNPSVDKTSLVSRQNNQVVAGPTVTPLAFYVVDKKLKVVDSERGGATLSGAGLNISLSSAAAESPKEFARFKKEGRAEIQLDGAPSSDSAVVFKIQIASGEDNLAEMENFDIKLRHLSANSWQLEMSEDSLSRATIRGMLASLQRLTLQLKPVAAPAQPAPEVTPTTFPAIE